MSSAPSPAGGKGRRNPLADAGAGPEPAERGSRGTAAPGDEGTAALAAVPELGLRIGDAAARAGLSARTLRYYEELGLLTPSSHTAGGERRYSSADVERLERIVELRDILGMNLDEVKGFLDTEAHLVHAREAYRARKSEESATARAQRRELLEEILRLSESLAEQLDAKLRRTEVFRADLLARAQRCRDLLAEL